MKLVMEVLKVAVAFASFIILTVLVFRFLYPVLDAVVGTVVGLTLAMILLIVSVISTFVAKDIIMERLKAKRKLASILLDSRGDIVAMCIFACVMSIIIVALIVWDVHGVWATIVLLVAFLLFLWIADRVSNHLGRSDEYLQTKRAMYFAYVAVLASAANADDVVTDAERAEIADTARCWLAYYGYDDDDEETINSAISAGVSDDIGPTDAGGFVSNYPAEFRQTIFFDVCRVLFSSGDLTETTEQWLLAFLESSGIEDTSLLHMYTRKYAASGDDRQQCLSELGLPSNATPDEIKLRYRKLALDYHPDSLGNVRPQIRALAEAKMMNINHAYTRLIENAIQDAALYFQGPDGTGFRLTNRENPVAKCWLCNQANRVPELAEPSSARCGKCYALLGVAWNPFAAA